MRSYSHRLYRAEDSVVNNKAIQTYSAWWPECQHVTEQRRPGTGTCGLLVRTEVPHSHDSKKKSLQTEEMAEQKGCFMSVTNKIKPLFTWAKILLLV